MRKILSLTAATAASFAMGAAQADIILVDDFNLPNTSISLTATQANPFQSACFFAGAAGTCTPGGTSYANSISGVSAATERDVTVTRSATSSAAANPNKKSTVDIGGGPTFGQLFFGNDSGIASTGTVSWTLPVGLPISAQSSYFFSVLASTTQTPITQISFDFFGINVADNFSVAAQNVPAFTPNTPPQNVPVLPLTYAISVGEALKLANGGVLRMNISGGEGWSITLDQFAFQVPEPASLALAGLALIGAGFASRRRQR